MANESRLDVLVTGRDQLTPQLRSIESGVIRFVGAVSAALATVKLGSAPILAAVEFERELANVAKTTEFARGEFGKTRGELDQLETALLNMSLRLGVSAAELAKIAAAAGQQGLGRDGVQGIVQFTESVARMASVLELSAEQSATEIGKIINIFRRPLSEIEHAVSIINEVSNKSTASGEELLDVVRRIGDASGALNLEQATALAAAGLDFGQSAEVVGTSFAKIFSGMLEDADKFGTVMKGIATESGDILDGSAKQWIATVQQNGLKAFKLYLQGLRRLDAQSQQTAIVKLTGGGRIGSLLNKFVQDSTNSILDRAIAASEEGAKGFSAIEEQAKVLGTLSEQAKILGNSLRKLGIEGTAELMGPLTAYVAQLSAALQDEDVRRFVNEVGEAVGRMVGQIATAVKFVASLNVNWENFIKVAEVFAKVKLFQGLLALARGTSLFSLGLKSISTDAAKAKKATDDLSNATDSLNGAQKEDVAPKSLGIRKALAENLTKGYTKARESLVAYIAAQKEANAAAQAGAKQKPAVAASTPVVTKTPDTPTRLEDATKNVARRKALLQQAELNLANVEADNARLRQAQIERLEQQSNQRRLDIRQSFYQTRKALAAQGLQAEADATVTQERAALARETRERKLAIAALDEAYKQRAAIQSAALKAEVARNEAAVQQALATQSKLAQIASASKVPTASTQAATTKKQPVDVASAEAAVKAAVKRQADTVAAQQKLLARAIEREQALSAANRLKIEQAYQTQRQALGDKATRKQISELRANRAKLLAEEETRTQASLKTVDTYYAQRFAKQTAAQDRELASARAHHAALQAAVSAPIVAAVVPAAGTAAISKTTTIVGALASTLAFGRAALASFGNALRAFAGIASAAAGIISTAFFWITIVYSIADLLGLTEKFGQAIAKLGRMFGLDTDARRRAAVAEDERRRKMLEANAVMEEQDKLLKEIQDSAGAIDLTKVDQLIERARQAGDQQSQQAEVKKIGGILATVDVGADRKGATQDDIKAQLDAQIKVVEDFNRRLEKEQARASDLLKSLNADPAAKANPQIRTVREQRITADLVALTKQAEEAKQKMEAYKLALRGAGNDARENSEKFKKLADTVAGMFTPESAGLAEQFLAKIVSAREQMQSLQEEQKRLNQKQVETKDDQAAQESIKQELLSNKANQAIVSEQLRVLNADLQAVSAKILSQRPLSPQVIASVQTFGTWLALSSKEADGVLAALRLIDKAQLTGAKVLPIKPATTGEGTFNTKKENLKSKFKAELELMRAKLEAEASLDEEYSKQNLRREERFFAEGKKSIEDYYARRTEILQDAVTREVRLKRDEIEQINELEKKERGNLKPADIIRNEARRTTLHGQIAALEKSRDAITEENADAAQDALRTFNERVLQESLNMLQEGFAAGGTAEAFQLTLDSLNSEFEVFLRQLRNSGKAGAKELAESLEISFKFKASTASLDLVQRDFDRINGELARQQTAIDLAVQRGTLVASEADLLRTQSIEGVIAAQQRLLEQAEEALAKLGAERDVTLQNSKAFQDQAARVQELKLSIAQLGAQMNETAQEINHSLEESIGGFFVSLTDRTKSLRDKLYAFLRDVAGNVQKIFADDLAQRIVRGIGSSGSGGFGGFLANILGKGPSGKAPTGTAVDPLYVAFTQDMLGMFKLDTEGLGIGNDTTNFDLLRKQDAGLRSLPAEGQEVPTDTAGVIDTVAQKFLGPVGSMITSLGGSIKDTFLSAITGFKELFAPLISAIQAMVAADSVGSGTKTAGTAVSVVKEFTGGSGGSGAVQGDTAAVVANTAATVASTEATTGFGTEMGFVQLIMSLFGATTSSTAVTTSGAMGGLMSAALSAMNALFGLAVAAEAAAAAETASAVTSVVAHTGGIFGKTNLATRKVDPRIFNNALRYHVGGTAGLRPGEIPAIVEEGEQILTKRQQGVVAAALEGGKKGEMNIRNVLVTDPDFITDAMSSSQGERTIMTVISKNRMSIRRALE